MTAYENDLGKAGLLSLPVTLIILVVAFGALVAAGIPLLLALTAVFATFGLIALPSHVFPVAMQAPALVLLIGLAVGVDYSMFYLKREREERAAGRSERAALEAAAATSGRSVLISGLTVIVAMAGMFLTGDSTFASLGVAAIMVVAIAMLGSLTVLPALLSKLGDRVDRGRVPLVGRRRPQRRRRPDLGRDHRPRPAPAAPVDRPRRRAAAGACGAGAPAPHGHAGARTRSRSRSPSCRRTSGCSRRSRAPRCRRTSSSRPRTSRHPRCEAAIDQLRQRALASGRMYEPITVDVNRDATVANVSIPIAGKTTDRESDAALALLREQIVPETVGRLPNTETGVTGQAAQWKDSTDALKSNLPPVVAFVLLFAFGLMLVAFRSLVVAAKAMLLNLLSVAAAYGVLVLVFQHGFGKGLLGFSSTAGIDARGAAAALRDPVRPLDGLPRPRPGPDPGAVRPRPEHGRRDLERDQAHRRRRHQRRGRDGLRVLDLRRRSRCCSSSSSASGSRWRS